MLVNPIKSFHLKKEKIPLKQNSISKEFEKLKEDYIKLKEEYERYKINTRERIKYLELLIKKYEKSQNYSKNNSFQKTSFIKNSFKNVIVNSKLDLPTKNLNKNKTLKVASLILIR